MPGVDPELFSGSSQSIDSTFCFFKADAKNVSLDLLSLRKNLCAPKSSTLRGTIREKMKKGIVKLDRPIGPEP